MKLCMDSFRKHSCTIDTWSFFDGPHNALQHTYRCCNTSSLPSGVLTANAVAVPLLYFPVCCILVLDSNTNQTFYNTTKNKKQYQYHVNKLGKELLISVLASK